MMQVLEAKWNEFQEAKLAKERRKTVESSTEEEKEEEDLDEEEEEIQEVQDETASGAKLFSPPFAVCQPPTGLH